MLGLRQRTFTHARPFQNPLPLDVCGCTDDHDGIHLHGRQLIFQPPARGMSPETTCLIQSVADVHRLCKNMTGLGESRL
jgi:hypothetical protein